MRGDHDRQKTICVYKLQHKRHRHLYPVMRNSLLKLREHPWELECRQLTRDLGRKVSIGPFIVFDGEQGNCELCWAGPNSISECWNAARTCRFTQVLGPEIKADIGTKNVNAETLVKLMKAMNFEESTRRHARSLRIASDDEANNKGLSPDTESMNGNTNGVEHDDKEIDVISSGRMKRALKDHADQTRIDDVRAKYLAKTRSQRNWSAAR